MATTSTIIKALADEIRRKVEENRIVWPAGRGKEAPPAVHYYALPLNQGREDKDRPYIVIKFEEEIQEIAESAVDESILRLELVVGICSDSQDAKTGMEQIMAAVEWLEIELKNTLPVGEWAALRKTQKKVPLEQPIPVFQGYLHLEYGYYKPILRYEP